MVDPLVSAAFSVFSNKGAYALLLGSGISSTAGIPTGWQIVMNLARKLAVAGGEQEPADPEHWYREKFGDVPGYSQLLDSLGSTQAERLNLLRGYFEPSEQEREQGLKIPTMAHHAVAELVAGGYIRVVLTTNFDRLLDAAMESSGVTPVVVSTPDGVEGMLPLQHQGCVLVKLNGDYLDLRFRNTVDELSNYDPRLVSLLDRVLDEYGLIVCGWSADWDLALRAAIERARSFRFVCYWAHRGPMSGSAARLANNRRAVPIPIIDANSFLRSLAERVKALEDYARPHPLSEAMAAATVKRYLSEPRWTIALHDLMHEETERVYTAITSSAFPVQGVSVNSEYIVSRLKAYEAAVAVLVRITAIGCYWGTEQHQKIWSASLERLANFEVAGGNTVLSGPSSLPSIAAALRGWASRTREWQLP